MCRERGASAVSGPPLAGLTLAAGATPGADVQIAGRLAKAHRAAAPLREVPLTETRLPEDFAAAQDTVTDKLGHASLGYQIGLISRLLAQSLKKRNGKDGILPGQFPVAIELMANDGATQRALCERVRIDQSTMASTLKRMERNGVIVRKACVHDGRQSTIHMTPKGRTLFEAAAQNAAEVNRIAFESLDPAVTGQLRAALRHIVDRLSQDVQNCNPE